MLPTECNMPDLTHLDPLIKKWAISRLVVTDQGIDRQIAKVRVHFVRITDKALVEYINARGNLLEQIQSSQTFIYYLFHINYLESCISTTNRALQLFEHIRTSRHAPAIDRLVQRALSVHSKSIVEVRNIVEHISDAIRKDEIADDEPLTLSTSQKGDKAHIGKLTIAFRDLAQVITILNSFGNEFIDFKGGIST